MCIIMFIILLLFTTLGRTFAGYSGSSSNNVGNGYGYGYSGSYSGSGDNTAGPPIPTFEFGGLLNGYFDSLQKYHENFINTRGPHSYAITSASSKANVQAQSSLTFVNNDRLQQQAQQLATQNSEYASGFSSYGAPIGSNGDGAIASASIGPQGGYHTAAVYPENPNSPNIFSRFAESSPGGQGTGSNYGVFTSSLSSSDNVNGKPQNFHRATTTINDNGKISTYTVKNP